MRWLLLCVSLLLCAGTRTAWAYDAVDVALKVLEEGAEYLEAADSGGSAGPGKFDCSGLTHFAYAYVGTQLPKGTSFQVVTGESVTTRTDEVALLARGDLVFFANNAALLAARTVGHVGIYIGDGKFVHAESLRGLRIDDLSVDGFYRTHFLEARRLSTSPGPSSRFAFGETIVAIEDDVNVRGLSQDNAEVDWLGEVLNSQWDGKTVKGGIGTIIDTRPVFRQGNWYWRVDFASGSDGWVAESFLRGQALPPTVSSASCTAPIVGQAMTCSVVGMNLPSTVSATASNCSPSPMTAVAGGSTDLRQFTCTPVTAGELVQVSYLVPEFIGPLPPIPSAVTAVPPGTSDVVYSESFTTDPSWQSDQPGNFFWNASNGTYFARTFTAAPVTRPNRYGAIQLPTFDPTRGFTLTWDHKVNAVNGTGVAYFGLMSDDRLVEGSTATARPPLTPESSVAVGIGRVGPSVEYTSYRVYTASGQNLGGNSTHGPTFALGTWYRMSIRYNPGAGQVSFSAIDRGSGQAMAELTFARPVPAGAFSANMKWLGVANDAIGYSRFPEAPATDFAEVEIDNVSLTYTGYLLQSLQMPTGAVYQNQQLANEPICTIGIHSLYGSIAPSATIPYKVESAVELATGVLGRNVKSFQEIASTWGAGNYIYVSANSFSCDGIFANSEGSAWYGVTISAAGTGTPWNPWLR